MTTFQTVLALCACAATISWVLLVAGLLNHLEWIHRNK